MPKIPTNPAIKDLASDIVDTIREALLILDDQQSVVWANAAFFQLFHLSPEQTLGRPLSEIRNGEWNIQALKTLLNDVLPRQKSFSNYEIEHDFTEIGRLSLLLDGRQLEANLTNGSLILLVMNDVTDHRRTSAQQARLAALVESSDDAIIAQTFDGTIVDWNLGAEQVYGYTSSEVIGNNISLLVPPEKIAEPKKLRDKLISGQLIRNHETLRVAKNGRKLPISLTMSPIRDTQGRTVLCSTVERDISKRVRREKELKQAKLAAEKATQIQGEFMANVSHELRTPMNAIVGMTDLALDENLTSEVRDYLETVKSSAEVLTELVNDVLDFSKMEAGSFKLESLPFSLRGILESLLRSMGLRAYEKGLELICDVDSSVPDRFVGDSLRLRQLLANLITNAIKFTQTGEVELRIVLDETSESQCRVRFTVRDTGIGISPEDQERIFAPFTQADASTTRNYTGTGLGLAICTQLVELMNGQLQLDSTPGKGSEFSFTAKFDRVPSTEGDDFWEEGSLRKLEGMTVLIVDDNETNRTLLEKTLRNWSLKPITVSNGAAALKYLRDAARRNESISLVILDALMPDMDGFEVAQAIQQDDSLANATVLMLSSADRQTFRDRMDQLQISAYLEKPVTQSDLWDTIVSSLGGTPVKRTALSSRDLNQPASRSLHLLLVEDTPANQKVVRRILEKRGHTLDIAHNGRDALEILSQERNTFDAILMDVQMPIMDGYQTTQAIRNSESRELQGIPIIAMTAHAMSGDREKCIEAGMDSYLSKPIDARKMIRLIESYAFGNALAESDENISTISEPEPQLHLDLETALHRLGDDEELLHDMLGFVTEDVPTLLQELKAACATNDVASCERLAHTIQGLVANFDSEGTVVNLALSVKEYAAREDIDQVRSTLPRLEQTATRFVELAEEVLKEQS